MTLCLVTIPTAQDLSGSEGRAQAECQSTVCRHQRSHNQRHLGAALGSRSFAEEYISSKVEEWVKEIMSLAEVTTSQPHAAYAAYTHGLSSHWNFCFKLFLTLRSFLYCWRKQYISTLFLHLLAMNHVLRLNVNFFPFL